ncbi:MAG: hypothetical protein ACFFFH_14305 [Candidatus Thorarchaeota archaeon]
MTKANSEDFTVIGVEQLPIVIQSKAGFTLIMIFLTILAIEFLGFIFLRLSIAQTFGELLIIIDIPSVIVLLIGAVTLTYLYYTRYVRRVLTLDHINFSLKVGKRLYEYEWSDFSIVALSIATAAAGVKGYTIRLYKNVDGEYVELPIYRFPKTINVFNLRDLIEKKVQKELQKRID